jgi:hypothetical protein
MSAAMSRASYSADSMMLATLRRVLASCAVAPASVRIDAARPTTSAIIVSSVLRLPYLVMQYVSSALLNTHAVHELQMLVRWSILEIESLQLVWIEEGCAVL